MVGFSTLTILPTEFAGERVSVVFWGDTILDREHWGTRALPIAMLGGLLRAKAKHPLRTLWVVVASKGWKTYLMMARNFPVHWPRVDVATPPPMQLAIDAVGARYSAQYANGVAAHHRGRLRPGVVELPNPIPAEAAFFLERNPGHADGHELICLARFDANAVIGFLTKCAVVSGLKCRSNATTARL